MILLLEALVHISGLAILRDSWSSFRQVSALAYAYFIDFFFDSEFASQVQFESKEQPLANGPDKTQQFNLLPRINPGSS